MTPVGVSGSAWPEGDESRKIGLTLLLDHVLGEVAAVAVTFADELAVIIVVIVLAVIGLLSLFRRGR